MGSYCAKENHIDSAISEIHRYIHTDKQTNWQRSCYFMISTAILLYLIALCLQSISMSTDCHCNTYILTGVVMEGGDNTTLYHILPHWCLDFIGNSLWTPLINNANKKQEASSA